LLQTSTTTTTTTTTYLGTLVGDVQCAQDQNETRESGVARHRFEPIVVERREHHLRLGRLQNHVAKLFDFHARLERQRQLGAFDHNVGKIQTMHLNGSGCVRVRESKQW
jgi:hypothetical protein